MISYVKLFKRIYYFATSCVSKVYQDLNKTHCCEYGYIDFLCQTKMYPGFGNQR